MSYEARTSEHTWLRPHLDIFLELIQVYLVSTVVLVVNSLIWDSKSIGIRLRILLHACVTDGELITRPKSIVVTVISHFGHFLLVLHCGHVHLDRGLRD